MYAKNTAFFDGYMRWVWLRQNINIRHTGMRIITAGRTARGENADRAIYRHACLPPAHEKASRRQIQLGGLAQMAQYAKSIRLEDKPSPSRAFAAADVGIL